MAEMKQILGQKQLIVSARDAMERGFCRPRALRSRRRTPCSILPVVRKGNFVIISKTPWAELVGHTIEIPLQVASPSLRRQIALQSDPNQAQCTNFHAFHAIDIDIRSLCSKMCRNFIQHSVANLISSICKFVIFAVRGRPKKYRSKELGELLRTGPQEIWFTGARRGPVPSSECILTGRQRWRLSANRTKTSCPGLCRR